MKKKILITGIAGTGKSTLCREMQAMGFEAYGIEDMPGLFTMYHDGTDEPFTDFDNSDPSKINSCDWRCNIPALQALLDSQKNDVAFYCGVATHIDPLLPLFDKVFLLEANPEVLYARLATREGTDSFANTEETRQMVLRWKPEWEATMEHKGMEVIDANVSSRVLAEQILARVQA